MDITLEMIYNEAKSFNDIEYLNSDVFKLQHQGTDYGVKRIKRTSEKGNKDLTDSEVYFLKMVNNVSINFPEFIKVINDSDYNYIISKWISGPTLFTWLQEQRNFNEMYNMFMQIFIVIYYMNSVLGLIHGDMIPQNILLQPIKSGGTICYVINNHKIYLKNLGYVPVIWDYGFSRTKNFGYYRINEIQKQEQIDENLVDYYKLIDSLLYDKLKINNYFYEYAFLKLKQIATSGLLHSFPESKTSDDIVLVIDFSPK